MPVSVRLCPVRLVRRLNRATMAMVTGRRITFAVLPLGFTRELQTLSLLEIVATREPSQLAFPPSMLLGLHERR